MPQKNKRVVTIGQIGRKANTRTAIKCTRASVLKMLAVMEASQAGNGASKDKTTAAAATAVKEDGSSEQQQHQQQLVVVSHEDFLMSGRTGRRNALPDIMGTHASTSSSDLPSRLENLTTKDRSDDASEQTTAQNKEAPSTSTNTKKTS